MFDGLVLSRQMEMHLMEMRSEIDLHGYDVICLSETWMKSSTPNRLIPVPGYQILRRDRPDGKGYGGVAVLVRQPLEATLIECPGEPTAESRLESLWVQIGAGPRRVMVCSLYRPPTRTAAGTAADIDELERQLQYILTRHSGTIIISGDANINLADGVDGTATVRLREVLSCYGMRRHTEGPTYRPSGSEIDFICSNGGAVRTGSLHCHFSPHSWSRALLAVPEYRPARCSMSARCWSRLDVPEANSRLRQVDWSPVFSSADPASQWDYFTAVTSPIIDGLVPVRRFRARNPTAPPLSDATKQLMARRRAALSDGDRDSYKELNRRVRAAIRRDTRGELQRRIQESGKGSLWRSIQPVIAAKQPSRVAPSADPDSLNRHFVSVGARVARQVDSSGPELPVRLTRVTTGRFDVTPVSPESLTNTVASMNGSTAAGDDGLCMRFVKLCWDSLCHVVTHIVNSGLASHTVPAAWKVTYVHPIQKNSKSTEPSNYRPISILPTIAKITERVVYEQLSSYFNSHDLFSSHQHGFRAHHSTETALVTISDRILEAIDRREIGLLCLLDMSKCFDVIPHDRLLWKLHLYNVDTRWFTSYLSDHYQRVLIQTPDGERVTSQPLLNPIGTYQGSALGPLMFSIYALDLPLHRHDSLPHSDCLVQYADDCQVAVFGRPSDSAALVRSMELNLDSLSKWFCKNGMKINADKTQLIVFGSRQILKQLPTISVHFMGSTVTGCPSLKNLGVVFDQQMTFASHVDDVVRRCTGMLVGLSHCRHSLPRQALVTIVEALVVSVIRYCISVYGSCNQTQMARIQRLMNFGARVVSGRRKHEHISDVIRDLGWLSAHNLYRYHSLMLLKRIMLTGYPDTLYGLTVTRGELHSRQTRQVQQLHTPAIRTESGRRRFMYSVVKDFNELPHDMRELGLPRFKSELRRYLRSAQVT